MIVEDEDDKDGDGDGDDEDDDVDKDTRYLLRTEYFSGDTPKIIIPQLPDGANVAGVMVETFRGTRPFVSRDWSRLMFVVSTFCERTEGGPAA